VGERGATEKRAIEMEDKKAHLKKELSYLRSQTRIHHLSITDLQDRLAYEYADRQERARKLKLADEARRKKVRKLCVSVCVQVCLSIQIFTCLRLPFLCIYLQDKAYPYRHIREL